MIHNLIKTFIIDSVVCNILNKVHNTFRSFDDILVVGETYRSIRVFDFEGLDEIVTLHDCFVSFVGSEYDYEKQFGLDDVGDIIEEESKSILLCEVSFMSVTGEGKFSDIQCGVTILYADQVIEYVK
jgi:hypothetical protein